MRIARIFSKQGPPIGRWDYVWPVILLPNLIIQTSTSWNSSGHPYLVFDSIMLLIFIFMWPLLTIRRLITLKFSRLWILPILVPIVVAMLAGAKGWRLVLTIALELAFVFQLPLVVLPWPRNLLTLKELLSSATKSSNELLP